MDDAASRSRWLINDPGMLKRVNAHFVRPNDKLNWIRLLELSFVSLVLPVLILFFALENLDVSFKPDRRLAAGLHKSHNDLRNPIDTRL